jgi:hypothetical protein
MYLLEKEEVIRKEGCCIGIEKKDDPLHVLLAM